MEIKKSYKYESCGKERQFRFNTKTNKVYAYKPKCVSCMLTERNKSQNFSPRKHPLHDTFESIDTQEKAYIFGFLWADGHLQKTERVNKADCKSIIINLHPKDKEIINFCIAHIGGIFQPNRSI